MSREELLKAAKPILFNTEMVQAILDGKKTETRRIVTKRVIIRPDQEINENRKGRFELYNVTPRSGIPQNIFFKSPYGPNDILYVRETWQKAGRVDDSDRVIDGTERYYYAAGPEIPPFDYWVDSDTGEHKERMPWKPSIHMPKEAARIFLKVTDIRPEHLQDIDDNGVVAEGLQIGDPFDELWDSTIKKADQDRYGWEANPWVWVIKFKKLESEGKQ